MPYNVEKSIKQYSLVDLLEAKNNPKHKFNRLVNEEIALRKPTDKQLENAQKEFQIRLRVKTKAAEKPLTLFEKLIAFMVPFSNRGIFNLTQMDQESEYSYELYGETRKMEEYKKWKTYGFVFYGGIMGISLLISIIVIVIGYLK